METYLFSKEENRDVGTYHKGGRTAKKKDKKNAARNTESQSDRKNRRENTKQTIEPSHMTMVQKLHL